MDSGPSSYESRPRATGEDAQSHADVILNASLAHRPVPSNPSMASVSSQHSRRSSASSATLTSVVAMAAPGGSQRPGEIRRAVPSPSSRRASFRARLAAVMCWPKPPRSSAASTITRDEVREDVHEVAREVDHSPFAQVKGNPPDITPSFGSTETTVTGGPSDAEAELRVLWLQHESLKAKHAAPARSTADLFKSACSTDLLFLMDTTGSMTAYIEAAKSQVKSIVDDIKLAFMNEADVRIAVVGYKDHGDKPNIQFLDFTTDVCRVRSFLDELSAFGGGDVPEDVLGGIQKAIDASWSQQTRCMIHIADAPPHGRMVLNEIPMGCDSYPKAGGEPHRLTHEPLLKKMIDLNINYALLRINASTNLMAFAFLKSYAAVLADCKLLASNTYCNRAIELSQAEFRDSARVGGSSMAKRRAKATLQFEEAELGTSYKALQHLVVRNVTSSASRTLTRVSADSAVSIASSSSTARNSRSITRQSKGSRLAAKFGMNLGSINEDEKAGATGGMGSNGGEEIALESAKPQWEEQDWFNETLHVEAFSTDVLVHGISILDDMMESDDNIKLSTTDLTIHRRSNPFAQGAMRVASYARTSASTNRLVVKSFKKEGKDITHLADDMRCQALCKAFALEFSALAGEENSVDFIVASCLKPKVLGGRASRPRAMKCLSLEPFIEGDYIKYNSNGGWVNDESCFIDPFNQTAQAFSHFTFERSQGRFLISDLQGVGQVLTDPAVHTKDPERFKLADTNLGEAGFKFFFSTHKCNGICAKLGLKSNSTMFMADGSGFEFRETWPAKREVANMTVCCSNKLCSRIVRVSRAKKSTYYPGYYWCTTCWPQLNKSKVPVVCAATGRHHEFNISSFFYESQGQIMPRMCPQHRSGAEPVMEEAEPEE
ncbi:hypothetical protein MKZ38_006817 [Zalerion maritima]|uniref:Alpha-type protein kinase domain-containing protein n=1 Tax=Zalerion maritima TaxID=339359 RepID=A0AAD5RVA3_9PEZI|nr:hypothetical protein MKZ38_006817 [Zalerion maritima]